MTVDRFTVARSAGSPGPGAPVPVVPSLAVPVPRAAVTRAVEPKLGADLPGQAPAANGCGRPSHVAAGLLTRRPGASASRGQPPHA